MGRFYNVQTEGTGLAVGINEGELIRLIRGNCEIQQQKVASDPDTGMAATSSGFSPI